MAGATSGCAFPSHRRAARCAMLVGYAAPFCWAGGGVLLAASRANRSAASRAACRTHDRTRPMLHQRKKVLVNQAPSTHDPKPAVSALVAAMIAMSGLLEKMSGEMKDLGDNVFYGG